MDYLGKLMWDGDYGRVALIVGIDENNEYYDNFKECWSSVEQMHDFIEESEHLFVIDTRLTNILYGVTK